MESEKEASILAATEAIGRSLRHDLRAQSIENDGLTLNQRLVLHHLQRRAADLESENHRLREMLERSEDEAAGETLITESLHDQKTAEEELRESQRRLRHSNALLETVIGGAGVMVAALDTNLRCVFVNRAYRREVKRLTGKDIHPGCDMTAVFPDSSRQRRSITQLRRRAMKGRTVSQKITVHDAHGKRRVCNARFVPIRDADGQIVGTGEVALDITEQIKAEEAVHVAEERFRVAQDLSLDGFAILEAIRDGDGTIIDFRTLYANPAAGRLVLHPHKDLVDQRLLRLLPGTKTHSELFERFARVVESGQPHDIELSYQADGIDAWFRNMCVKLGDGVAVYFGDITERKRAEEELRRAKAAAEAATVAKSQFLATMSHEVRTPMNAILGMTSMALAEKLSPTVRDYLQTVKDSADALLTILNEILDFSRIEARRIELESIAFSPRQVTEQAVKTLAVRAKEKGLELVNELCDNLPAEVMGDPLRLRQVLLNLIGNAIKFTDHGRISVHAEVERQTAESTVLKYRVTDTGKGISPEECEKIFHPFTQADASTTRRYGGTGLGLSICQQLVSLMGGNIWVESKAGQGSMFLFTVVLGNSPSHHDTATQARPVDREVLQDTHVLVVAQNTARRRMLQQTLASWGMWTDTIGDVTTAIAKLQEAADASKRYHLVLADLGMTGADGFTLAEWLKHRPKLAGAMILMLSPTQRQTHAERCRVLQVSCLEKPISPSALLNAVARALKLELLLLPPTKQEHPPTPVHALRVLLAEDTPANQKLIRHMLHSRGHAVRVATTGREVLQLIAEHDFDAILMDVQMPVMDGLQATAAVRALRDPRKASIPIIAMTAYAMNGDRERCLAAGMDAYFSKPIDCQRLIASIERLASPQHAETKEGSICCGLKTPCTRPDKTAAAGTPPETEPFQFQEALSRCLGKYGLFQEIVTCFFEEVDRLIDDLKTAVHEGNAERLRSVAHRLKGTLVLLCAHPSQLAAQEVEQIGTKGDLARGTSAVHALARSIEYLKQALAVHRV